MAGKADVTKDENFEQLKVLFQSVCLNAVANEGNLLLHRNSVINGIAAYDGVLQAASDLFPEDEQDALTIFEQASSALSEGVKVRRPTAIPRHQPCAQPPRQAGFQRRPRH